MIDHEINLLPWRAQRARHHHRRRGLALMLLWGLCGAGLVGHYGYLQWRQAEQQHRNDSLLRATQQLAPEVAASRKLAAQHADLLARLQWLNTLQSRSRRSVQLFATISQNLPAQLYFERLVLAGEELRLYGRAQSNAQVSQLMEQLAASPWLTDPDLQVINIVTTQETQGTQGPAVSEFEIKAIYPYSQPRREPQHQSLSQPPSPTDVSSTRP